MNVSFQLYSSRDVASQEAFLSNLAEYGYTQVEGYGGVFEDPASFRAAMDKAGLAMPSAHMGIDDLESDLEGCLKTASTLGITQIFAPHLAEDQRPTDRAGYADFAKRLSAIHAKLATAGISFGWHNHDFELRALADGSIPLEVILSEAPEISWEADIAWVIRGGADPVAWIDRSASRIAALHVTAIAPEGENLDQDGWTNVGSGTVDWADLVARCRTVAPYGLMVMEHDKPADPVEFAQASIASFKTY